MAASDVFPQSNLPGAAVPWGRSMEALARSNEYAIESLRLATRGDNRAQAGQLGVAGNTLNEINRQVSELGSRGSGSVVAGNLTVTSTSTTSWASATRTIQIPGESGGSRTNILTFSAAVSQGGSGSGANFCKIEQGSNLLYAKTLGLQLDAPSGWTPMVNASFVYPISSAGTTFTVTIYAINMVGSRRTVTLQAPTFTYVRANTV